MPCDTIRLNNERERRLAEQRREEELARLERDIEAGIAQIVLNQDGSVTLLGVLPQGMQEACTLAALQRRSSAAFQYALQTAGVYGVDFIQLHGHSHGH